MCNRRLLIDSIVESKTGTTRGSPFSLGGQGRTPLGVGFEVEERSLGSDEVAEQKSNTLRMYCSWGGICSVTGIGLFYSHQNAKSDNSAKSNIGSRTLTFGGNLFWKSIKTPHPKSSF